MERPSRVWVLPLLALCLLLARPTVGHSLSLRKSSIDGESEAVLMAPSKSSNGDSELLSGGSSQTLDSGKHEQESESEHGSSEKTVTNGVEGDGRCPGKTLIIPQNGFFHVTRNYSPADLSGLWCIGRELGKGAKAKVILVERPNGSTGKVKKLALKRTVQEDALAEVQLMKKLEAIGEKTFAEAVKDIEEAETNQIFVGGGGEIPDENLPHPNIARLYGVADLDGQGDIIMLVQVGGKELTDALPTLATDQDTAASITAAVSSVIEFLARCHIIHRDLKPPNVLVDMSTVGQATIPAVLVIDFGAACDIERNDACARPSLKMQATRPNPPESGFGKFSLFGTPFTKYPMWSQDMWQLGVTVGEMGLGRMLTSTLRVGEVSYNSGNLPSSLIGWFVVTRKNMDRKDPQGWILQKTSTMRQLMGRMLQPHLAARITPLDALGFLMGRCGGALHDVDRLQRASTNRVLSLMSKRDRSDTQKIAKGGYNKEEMTTLCEKGSCNAPDDCEGRTDCDQCNFFIDTVCAGRMDANVYHVAIHKTTQEDFSSFSGC